jgi:hypothetical protein
MTPWSREAPIRIYRHDAKGAEDQVGPITIVDEDHELTTSIPVTNS